VAFESAQGVLQLSYDTKSQSTTFIGCVHIDGRSERDACLTTHLRSHAGLEYGGQAT
jgi:hypothetical protein